MNIIKSLREGFFPTKKPDAIVVSPPDSVVLGTVEQSYGVRPSPNFSAQVVTFNEDPVIKESVLQFAQQVISTGIYTTGATGYTVSLPKINGSGSWTAKNCIDEWNRVNNLDAKILTIAAELDGFGNSFWQIVNGLNYIPIQAIDQAKTRTKDVTIREDYSLIATASYGGKKISAGSFIHFKTNIIGLAPFGSGIVYSIMTAPSSGGLSVYDLRLAIRTAMKAGFDKFSFGNELWSFEGLSNAKLAEVGAKVTGMDATGQRVATNVKGDIKIAVPGRTTSYDIWLQQVQTEFLMALANPSLKLGLEQGFTKATAEAAQEMFASKIESLRREIKRQIEGLWSSVLTENGFDPIKADIRLHFGSEDVDYEPADLFKAVELGVVSVDEARGILRDSMKWKLETTKLIKAQSMEEAVKIAKETRQLDYDEIKMQNVQARNELLKKILEATK